MLEDRKTEIEDSVFEITKFENRYTSDSSLSISIPVKWENINLSNNAEIQAGDNSKKMYVIAGEEKFNNANIDTIPAALIKLFSKSLENIRIIDSSFTKKNNFSEIRYTFSGTKNNYDLTYYFVLLVKDKKVYEVFFWTPTDVFRWNKIYCEKIAGSIEIR